MTYSHKCVLCRRPYQQSSSIWNLKSSLEDPSSVLVLSGLE